MHEATLQPQTLEDSPTLRYRHRYWLNQIECWFSILMRRLLKRGNFTSPQDLKQKILNFIA